MNGQLGGVYLAIVDSNKLDAEGRIGIAIPHSDRAGSYPARLASLMAGDQRGVLFVPEKGDEVLVAFVNGLPDVPVVIGGLWSRVDKPPEPNADGKNDVKLIKTRGGNEIRLTDRSGGERIEITGKGAKTRITLDIASDKIEITANGGVTIKGSKITLDGNVDITKTLVVGSKSKTTIDGNQITGS